MYLKKVEHLRSLFPAENCISAITTATLNGTSVGTPCIVNIKPFTANKLNTQQRGFDLPNREVVEVRVHPSDQPDPPSNRGRIKIKKDAPSLTKSEKDIIYAKGLYEMDISKANSLIQNSVGKASALFVFSTRDDYVDFYTSNVYGHNIYFNGAKPIILDDGKRFELYRLSDVHNKTDLNNFAEITYNSLQNNRYINYTFTDVMESNKKYMLEDVNLIFSSLKKMCQYNVACFRSISDGLRNLIDVISISFYRLPDVFAVFDSSNTMGMGIEVLMTNSLYDSKTVSRGEQSITCRFLFSSSRENIFTIDGESVSRASDCHTDKAVRVVHETICKEVPHDKALKNKKAKMNK